MTKKITKLASLFTAYNQEVGKNLPIVLSEGQQEIFECIVKRKKPRVHVMTVTQYGKSFTVALAVLIRAVTKKEKWAIVAPSHPKAMIIMRYIIDFCFTNDLFKTQLDMDEGTKDRLKREVSKSRITFRGGGEIFVLSADNRNKQAAGEALMGFGSPNIILDESSLIDDDVYAKIKRMLGGHKDNFILEIGNPFNRNHFMRNYLDDDYYKVVVDWKRAVKEGRMQEDFVKEMRKEAFFDILYECQFPKQEDVDSDGWSVLLAEDEIKACMRSDDPSAFGQKRLGVDIARSGGNFNVWVLRTGNFAKVLARSTTDNLMDIIGTTRDLAEKNGVEDHNVFIDATGIGAGVYDRFREVGWDVAGVNMSESAINTDRFINIRAESYFRVRDWIKAGGMLAKDNFFFQLMDIKYKMRSNGKLKIIDKETLKKNGIPSPDVADALMLTFCRPEETYSSQRLKNIKLKQFNQPKYV